MFKFNLGDTVKDTITGFQGIVTSRTQWLNGCIRYGVDPTKLKDGRPIDGIHIDEGQIILVKAAKPKKVEARGGPQRDEKSPFRR